MELTNTTGVPRPIFNVLNRWYNNHPESKQYEFTATEVLKSSKQILLRRLHDKDVEKDVQLAMKPILGTWMHFAMSNALEDEEDCTVEKRFRRPINVHTKNGLETVEISGGVDLLYRDENGLHIIDYKNTNQAKLDKAANGDDTSFLDQMYIYAWLIEYELGERPVDGTIVGVNTLLRAGEVDINDPQKRPIQLLSFDLMDSDYEDKLIGEIEKRISMVLDNDVCDCSDSEMWLSERRYGVKKPENKRFTKIFDSKEEAESFVESKGPKAGYVIVDIIPDPKKCRCFCDYLPWCKQGQEAVDRYLIANKENEND